MTFDWVSSVFLVSMCVTCVTVATQPPVPTKRCLIYASFVMKYDGFYSRYYRCVSLSF